MKSLYENLLKNAPNFDIPKGIKEIHFTLISCMCDNKNLFTFKKNEDGEFKLNCHGSAYSNFQLDDDKYELEWLADEGLWDDLIFQINQGVQKVQKVRFR